jgi:hypothetical protein
VVKQEPAIQKPYQIPSDGTSDSDIIVEDEDVDYHQDDLKESSAAPIDEDNYSEDEYIQDDGSDSIIVDKKGQNKL